MNVRMPDGTIVQNVPEGITQADLQGRLDASRQPPREASSRTDRFLTGLMDPVVGAAQLADRAINPVRQWISPGASSMDDYVKNRDKEYQAPEGVDWMRMAGNVANPVNLAAPGAGVARAAAMGAVQSALAPTEAGLDLENFAKEKAKQAGIGGAAGGVLSKVLPRAMGGLVKPTDDALALQRAGIDLTPGQAAGGFLNSAEQKLMSIPIVGDLIGGARSRALGDFQTAALERASGVKGVKTIDAANEAVSGLYQRAVPHIKPEKNSEFLVHEAIEAARDNPELTEAGMKTLEKIHSTLFKNYNDLSPEALKRLDSELGAIARRHSGMNALPSDKVLAGEVRKMQDAMREGWRIDMADPAKAELLDAANRGYRGMVPVNKAGSTRADELVTPRALQKALARQAQKDVTRMGHNELVDPAVRVLGSTVPDSGTAGRLALPAAIVGGMAAPLQSLLAAAGTGAAYSRRGVNILTGNTAAQRQLAKMEPKTRAALIAAIRSQQSGHEPKGE